MKNFLFKITFVVSIFTALQSSAQLANGSIAPNFTLTDINGNSVDLYTYLNSGKTVFIDISATWCGPCWNYHNTHALGDLWAAHGPTGAPGVNANTTNDVVVLFIEGDGTTNSADLHGTGGDTQGDWVTGVDYPIIDPPANIIDPFGIAYGIAYFPTIYMICPNRTITEVGTETASVLYTNKGNCPAPASIPNDGALLNYTGATSTCGNLDMKVRIQNNGTSPLTACTITAKNGNTLLATYNWTGNLNTYGVANVTVGSIYLTNTSTLTFDITPDGDTLNNSLSKIISGSGFSTSIKVKIVTDQYGSETTWKIFNSLGTVVSSGGPYADKPSPGSYPQVDINLTLPNDCYRFELYDTFGDGFNTGYGIGSATIVSGSTNVFIMNTFQTKKEVIAFGITNATGIEKNEIINKVNIFPNPLKDNATVNFNLSESTTVSFEMMNAVGEIVLKENLGTLSIGEQHYLLNSSNFSNGLYFLTIRVGNNTIVKKIAINK